MFTSDAALRDRPFLDFKYGFAGFTIETEDQASLGTLQYGRNNFIIMLQINQGRLGRKVVIPHVVMNQLLVPGDFTACSMQCHQGVRIQVIAFALTAVKIRACGSGWHVHQAEAGVRREWRPGVR